MKSFACFIFLFLLSCSDNLQFTEKDLEKHPEIQPFLLDIQDFKGVHNIDLAILDFSYSISKSDDSVFFILDSIAKNEKWVVCSKSAQTRVYTKYIQSFPGDEEIDTLTISYRNDEKRIYYRWN